MTRALLRVPRLNTYASFTEMTINKAIGEAAPRLDYNQTTQMNQLAKEMVIHCDFDASSCSCSSSKVH